MSGNFAIKGGGVGRLMANAILNFHFDFLNPSLSCYRDVSKLLHRFAKVVTWICQSRFLFVLPFAKQN